MAIECENVRDLAGWIELLSVVAANVVIVAGSLRGLYRLKQISHAKQREVNALEDRLAVEFDKSVENERIKSHHLRAHILFDSYREWASSAAHFAAGDLSHEASGKNYSFWLQHALQLLSAVHLEGARAERQEFWETAIRAELGRHRSGLMYVDETTFQNGAFRKLLRQIRTNEIADG